MAITPLTSGGDPNKPITIKKMPGGKSLDWGPAMKFD
jgi:hypothetical protein